MTEVFNFAMEEVFMEEGGFVQDVRDAGGATNMGITINTLSLWRNANCTVDDVRGLTKEEATKIYRSLFWDKVHGDDLKAPVAILLFDAAINHGVVTAIRMAQRVLKLQDDGVFGPITLKMISKVDPYEFLYDFMSERAMKYVESSSFITFGRGWFHRLFYCSVKAGNFVIGA